MESSPFKVRWNREHRELKRPKVEISDNALYHAFQLAEAGYYGGNPESILAAPLDIVLNIIHYRFFNQDIERAYQELNREKK